MGLAAGINLIATSMTALVTPWAQKQFPTTTSRTPFADDRRRLRQDWEKVQGDLKKSIDQVLKEHGAETYSRRGSR